jgi:peroxiredoxin/uncharacterized membrane protein YphA (DoxX/SURF4 family)
MAATTLIARLILAAVFAVSGVAKLFDLAGSRDAVSNFGVLKRLAGIVGTLLPAVELVVAGALLVPALAWQASIAAGVLLLIFTAGIALQLSRGNAPDCHCFGQIHATPISRWTLLRNAVLLAIGIFIAIQGPGHTGAIEGVTTTWWLIIVAALVVLGVLAGQTWLLLHTMQQYGRLLIRIRALETGQAAGGTQRELDGLPVGEPAPAFELRDLEGESTTLDSLRARGRPVLLVFADPMCGPCGRLFPEIGAWQAAHGDSLTIPVISRGPVQANRTTRDEHGLSLILLQEGNEVADSYRAIGTPAAVVIRPDGQVATPLALGPDAIRALLLRTLEQGAMSEWGKEAQVGAAGSALS